MVLKIKTQLVVGERFDQDFFPFFQLHVRVDHQVGLRLFVYPDRPFIFGLSTTMTNGLTIFRLFIHLFRAS